MKKTTYTHMLPSVSSLKQITFVFGCIMALTLLAAFSASADWIAKGRQLSWQMQVPGDWFGGSYDQIRNVMEMPETRRYRHFFESFLSLAKDCDAKLWHYPDLQSFANEPSSFTTSTITAIRVEVGPSFGAIEFTAADMKYFFQVFADGMRNKAPPAASVTSLETKSFFVDNRSAYETTFRIDRPKQGRYYVVLVLVPLRDGALHQFTLDVDSSRFPARRGEFRSMLRTLRYPK